MAEDYTLEKWRWTHEDFERMGWHDAPVHAMTWLPETYEYALDIDYILKWVHPGPGETYFSFWIAPATLVFENVSSVQLDLESYGGITILDVVREDERPTREAFEGPGVEWLWTLDCLGGSIQVRATGYRQTIRRAPMYHGAQRISLAERGGISFSEQIPQHAAEPSVAADPGPE